MNLDPEHLKYLPFFLTTGGSHPKLSFVRIIESIIIAAVCASVTVYSTVQVLGVRIDSLEKGMDKLEAQINQLRQDFYVPRR